MFFNWSKTLSMTAPLRSNNLSRKNWRVGKSPPTRTVSVAPPEQVQAAAVQ
jgi:hypothetical protein